MIAVPLFERMGLGVKQAHATAIAVILPVTLISAAIYLSNGYFPIRTGTYAAIGAAVGGGMGALVTGRLASGVVDKIFAAVMLAAGLKAALS